MTEQLTGYEASSVDEIEAVLDDLPADAKEVYLRTIGYSERAIAAVAAKRAGGGGTAANWCLLSLDTPPPLTCDVNGYNFAASDLHILEQSGSDFSIATVADAAAVISARGGMFQTGAYIAAPVLPTLDAGSAATRYLRFSVTIGGPASPSSGLAQLGYATLTPIFPNGTDAGGGYATQSVASLPGVVSPGDPALWNPFVGLTAGFGTDSIPLDAVFFAAFGMLAVWQIA